ncbi:very short patch repair endonuclease [Paramagnetospirillum kuznetsovii]|uniref:Very short patch repair endonuclease n=1 Tax=Paramagnetospirillum kuznetsovii TaxID=2053833 RepID=A0A364NX60_9PROT|nr:very short patch repair endonuclease [Paramagnetospirillum kuznetsovii]RAU21674.1 very short patch repair endonuclease [Paramagnetospirillum kuznetsovii]
MVDHVPVEKRSEIMRAVKPKDTTPELLVRRMAHRLGLRFRLHVKKLPGCPDIVFSRKKTVIFVHGCFWHRHQDCKKATTPKSNLKFWEEKFLRNVERDAEDRRKLERLGWRVCVIWQCETAPPDRLEQLLRHILHPQDGKLGF